MLMFLFNRHNFIKILSRWFIKIDSIKITEIVQRIYLSSSMNRKHHKRIEKSIEKKNDFH